MSDRHRFLWTACKVVFLLSATYICSNYRRKSTGPSTVSFIWSGFPSGGTLDSSASRRAFSSESQHLYPHIKLVQYNVKYRVWAHENPDYRQMQVDMIEKEDDGTLDFISLVEADYRTSEDMIDTLLNRRKEGKARSTGKWQAIGTTDKYDVTQLAWNTDRWAFLAGLCKGTSNTPVTVCTAERRPSKVDDFADYVGFAKDNVNACGANSSSVSRPPECDRPYNMVYLKSRDFGYDVLLIGAHMPHAHWPLQDPLAPIASWDWKTFYERAAGVVNGDISKSTLHPSEWKKLNVIISGDFNELNFGDQLRYYPGDSDVGFSRLTYSANHAAFVVTDTSRDSRWDYSPHTSTCCFNDAFTSFGLFERVATTAESVSTQKILKGPHIGKTPLSGFPHNGAVAPNQTDADGNYFYYFSDAKIPVRTWYYSHGYPVIGFEEARNSCKSTDKCTVYEEHKAIAVELQFSTTDMAV